MGKMDSRATDVEDREWELYKYSGQTEEIKTMSYSHTWNEHNRHLLYFA